MKRTTEWLAVVAPLVLVGLFFVEAAHAQAPPDDEARRLYVEGEAHYAAGRYRDAAASFERAYELSRRPALLFNLGNAYERLGDLKRAADYLRDYLNSPGARGTELVRQRIVRLEATHAAQERERAERQAQRATAQPQPQAEPANKPSALPGYILLGIGAASLATAITLGVLSGRAGSDAEASCTSDGFCLRGAQTDLDREKGLGIGSDVALGVGLAAAGVGAYLLIRRALTEPEVQAERPQASGGAGLQLVAGPLPGGAEVGLVSRY